MKIKYILTTIICLIYAGVSAQKLGPTTVNNGGASVQVAESTYIYSIGEVMHTSITNGEITIKQGVLHNSEPGSTNPPGNCAKNTARVTFETCPEDNNLVYVFYTLEDGTVLDPYFDGIQFANYDGQYVNFDFVDADFETPCSQADKAVIVTCIEETLPPPDCSKNEGKIFFAPCEGETFFFIETAEGDTLDPYYADGLTFQHREGQLISFDYIDADIESPCSIANKAVTIRCIEERFISSTNNLNPDQLKAFPNPAKDILYLEAGQEAILSLKMYDINGKIVHKRQYDAVVNTRTIDLKSLAEGIYVVEAQTPNGYTSQKIVINR